METPQDYRCFQAIPLSGSLGAEIIGVDLSGAIPQALAAEITAAFRQFHMLCFRDQTLDLDAYRRFALLFGPFSGNPIHLALPGYPEFVRVVKEPNQDGPTFGGNWHADLTWFEAPPKATMLYVEEAPRVGGDTMFANLHLAWERLTPTLQRMIDGLIGIHSGYGAYGTNAMLKSVKVVDEGWEISRTEVEHPLVPRHPETGRPFLFVNPNVIRIKGMTEAESRPLLDMLFHACTRMDTTCRLVWRSGSIAVWDNRCLLHHAIGDYPQYRRVMVRTTIAGDRLTVTTGAAHVQAA